MKIFDLPDSQKEDAMYLVQDSRLAGFSIIVFTVMSALLCLPDYLSLGWGKDFAYLTLSRLILIASSVMVVRYLVGSPEKMIVDG